MVRRADDDDLFLSVLGIPDPIPVIDGLLAATALVHGLTLVTRNLADVASAGVRSSFTAS